MYCQICLFSALHVVSADMHRKEAEKKSIYA